MADEGADDFFGVEKDRKRLSPSSSDEVQGGSCVVRDTRIAVIGNVDSGKSTLIGVLTSGDLDDGRGSARSRIFRHDHERSNGRTSCVAQHIMGFKRNKDVVHQPIPAHATPKQKTVAWKRVVDQSFSLVTYIDLAGHEKYLKTTIAGLSGAFPDYAAIIVGSNMGVSKMTREHIAVATALQVPIFVVITKVDICPEKVLRHTLKQLKKVLRSPLGGQKMPVLMKKNADVDSALSTGLETLCPVFLISNVKGTNVDRLTTFIGRLPPRREWIRDAPDTKMEFEIDETFAVKGVGVVLSGTVTAGRLVEGMTAKMGPFDDGSFRQVLVRSIHAKRVPVQDAVAGESCSLSIRFLKKKEQVDRSHIRRGLVLCDQSLNPEPVWTFDASILVLHHATTIKPKYQPVIHCGNIRQTAVIKWISQEALRSGDSARVRFKFFCRAEFIHVGRTIIVREGSTRCIGKITRVYAGDGNLDPPLPDD